MKKEIAPSLILNRDRDKSLRRRHPWVFSGAVMQVDGAPEMGTTVAVRAARGEFLAWAAYSPHSQIRARVWSFKEDEKVDGEFFSRRITRCFEERKDITVCDEETNAYRLVFSESDGLPGVIADVYSDTVVLQCLTAGAEYHKEEIAEVIKDVTGCRSVYERSDSDARELEGLHATQGEISGKSVDGPVTIKESGLEFLVDVVEGQKTGFYLDQRKNRKIVRALSAGKKVLNCFSYTGGFTVNALAGGAKSVVSIDSSEKALKLAKENVALNGIGAAACEWIGKDVFETLREMAAGRKKFDLIVLDPPKFAATAAQKDKAERAYKDINMYAMRLLSPGGLLFTFSCSGAVTAADMQKICAWSAIDAGVDARIVKKMSQAPDHPISLSFPESEYLKGLVLRVFSRQA
jgi:23S rRNA (cytosine1962-C5)-methyltransferase